MLPSHKRDQVQAHGLRPDSRPRTLRCTQPAHANRAFLALSGLVGPLGPSDLRKMSAAYRSTWETAFTDATDSQSPLGG